jgi:hypothetical protein
MVDRFCPRCSEVFDCMVENVSNGRVGIFLVYLGEQDWYARGLVKGRGSQTFKLELVGESEYRKVSPRPHGMYFTDFGFESCRPKFALYSFPGSTKWPPR